MKSEINVYASSGRYDLSLEFVTISDKISFCNSLVLFKNTLDRRATP